MNRQHWNLLGDFQLFSVDWPAGCFLDCSLYWIPRFWLCPLDSDNQHPEIFSYAYKNLACRIAALTLHHRLHLQSSVQSFLLVLLFIS